MKSHRVLTLLAFLVIFIFNFDLHSQTSVRFTASGSYIKCDYTSQVALDSFTIECWFKIQEDGNAVITGEEGTTAIPLISRGIESTIPGEGLNFFLGIREMDKVITADFESSETGNNNPVFGFTSLKNDEWYHAAVTYDGRLLQLYLNGKIEVMQEIGEPVLTSGNADLTIGTVLTLSDQDSGYFNGYVDEIRIWNFAKTREEIRKDLNNELSEDVEGLVTGINLNEGEGIFISSIGSLSPAEIIGDAHEWSDGAPFNVIFPPECLEEPVLRIGLITDPQYCDCDNGPTRYYRESLIKLPLATDSFNFHNVDYTITLGDVIDKGFESYDSILPLYDKLEAPDYHLLGNHEFTEMHDSFKVKVLEKLEMPNYYYDFEVNGWKFLVLDGTELGSYTSVLHPELQSEADSIRQRISGQINDYDWNGGFSMNQLSWIETELIESLEKDQNVILYCHWPVYPFGTRKNLWNDTTVVNILEKYPNVVAYINGHNHDGNYAYRNGIHYINQIAMVETPFNNSFSIMDIYSDRLILKGYGLNPDRFLRFNGVDQNSYSLSFNSAQFDTRADSGSYIGNFIFEPNYSTSTSYKSNLISENKSVKNNYFIRNDSLFLNTGKYLTKADELQIEVLAVNCRDMRIDTIIHLQYDSLALAFSKRINDTSVNLTDGKLLVQLKDYFIDKSRFGLEYVTKVEDHSIINVNTKGDSLSILPLDTGSVELIIEVRDSFTNQYLADTFTINVIDSVNQAPILLKPIPDFVLFENDESISIDLDTICLDEDQLFYILSQTDNKVAEIIITNSILRISPLSPGQTIIDLTANDLNGGSVFDQFSVTVLVSHLSISRISDIADINLAFLNNTKELLISLKLSKQSTIDITFYNTKGQVINALSNHILPIGNQNLKVSLEDFQIGFYLVKVEVNGNYILTEKILIK